MRKKYRPTNYAVWGAFKDKFCDRCEYDREADCYILDRALGYGVDHPNYPTNLTYDQGDNPVCTSFVRRQG